jgi:hypothetical protein
MKVNGSRYEKDGWICIDIHGSPYERGYTIGYLLSKEIKDVMRMLDFLLMNTYGLPRLFFSDVISELFRKQIKERFMELYIEMEGIVEGIKGNDRVQRDKDNVTLDDIIMWNCFLMIDSMFSSIRDLLMKNAKLKKKYGHLYDKKAFINKPRMIERCSAFIAVGDYTKDGKIVCSHNSFSSFLDTQYSNIIMYVYPDKGNSFVMQTSPGWVWSGTDFYISSNGFICTETTIGAFTNFKLLDPIFCRIRKAVQYSKTLDDYSKILVERNGGDYANAWLIGDINTNTIMRIELGFKFVNIEKKTNGYFIGYNTAEDPRIRNMETDDTDLYNIKTSSGARRVRLTELMEKYKGKINVKIGQKILADHYDVYLKKINPSNRTCCSHYDLDETRFIDYVPFYPGGALDGIVTDSTMAKEMSLSGRWGNSCGIAFDAKKYIDKHPQWSDYAPYLLDRPSQKWSVFKHEHVSNTKHSNTKHSNSNTMKKKRRIRSRTIKNKK